MRADLPAISLGLMALIRPGGAERIADFLLGRLGRQADATPPTDAAAAGVERGES
jgi:hypothetical protein